MPGREGQTAEQTRRGSVGGRGQRGPERRTREERTIEEGQAASGGRPTGERRCTQTYRKGMRRSGCTTSGSTLINGRTKDKNRKPSRPGAISKAPPTHSHSPLPSPFRVQAPKKTRRPLYSTGRHSSHCCCFCKCGIGNSLWFEPTDSPQFWTTPR